MLLAEDLVPRQGIEETEQLAIERTRAVFGGDHVNVRPRSRADANAAVYRALVEPGDRVMGFSLERGGLSYGVREDNGLIDMDRVAAIAAESRPRLILAGGHPYPRQLDFAAFREVADSVGARLWVDMAHFAGLVAAGVHPDPVPHADVVSATVEEATGSAGGAVIICREEHGQGIDAAVPADGAEDPPESLIAAQAEAMLIAPTEERKLRQRRALFGARAIAEQLMRDPRRLRVWTGGTDVPIVVADLRRSELDGKRAQERLERIGVAASQTRVPLDPRPAPYCSGVWIDTRALVNRGLGVPEFRELGELIWRALTG
jgi:glycine hydroxymethyltransferase